MQLPRKKPFHKQSTLHLNLHTTLATRRTALEGGQEVGDVVPRMSVQTSAQSLLVEVMGNETDGATQDEQTVEHTHGKVVLSLLRRESTAVAEQVHEADSHAAVDVEDQVVLLGGGHGFHGKSIVEHLAAGEALLDELLDQLDTEIGVVPRLDLVADTGDELVLLAHGVDEVTRAETLVERLGELLSSTVEGTTES